MNADSHFDVDNAKQRLEKLRALMANLPQVSLATALASIALTWLIPGESARVWPLLWLILLNSVGLCRLLICLIYKKNSPDDLANLALNKYVIACALASGVIWASGIWVLEVPELHLQAAILFTCLAIALGGAFVTVASRTAAFAVFIPAAFAPVVYGAMSPVPYYQVIGALSALYALVVIQIIVKLNKQTMRQLELRFENHALLHDLRKRTEEAEAASEAKSRFLASASHDLRQPMHTIALFVKALASQQLNQVGKEVIKRLEQSVSAMEILFNALLDISRLETGIVTIELSKFDLHQLFARMKEDFQPLALERKIELKVRPTPFWVQSDRILLERVLRNLISNAINYTAKGGVLLCARQRGHNVSIEVWDTGSGIPQHELQAVFREFYQLQNPARDRRKGLGLGLAIVDRIAKLLGHKIELKSKLSKGTSVRMQVPICMPKINRAPTAPVVEKTYSSLRDKLLLVVDDDPDVLDAMVILLKSWGCEVAAGLSSAEILEKLPQLRGKPDAIITDYRLDEEKNGFEVIQVLRERLGIPAPAIVITGDMAIKLPKHLSHIRLLRKPCLPERLFEAITGMIDQYPTNPA